MCDMEENIIESTLPSVKNAKQFQIAFHFKHRVCSKIINFLNLDLMGDIWISFLIMMSYKNGANLT